MSNSDRDVPVCADAGCETFLLRASKMGTTEFHARCHGELLSSIVAIVVHVDLVCDIKHKLLSYLFCCVVPIYWIVDSAHVCITTPLVHRSINPLYEGFQITTLM